MIVSSALLGDLRRVVGLLEADLRARSEDPAEPWAAQLRAEHARASERGRTARSWSEWRDGEAAQAAVAWVLACTFVRFCEDNGLLDGTGPAAVWIAGPGDRLGMAVENQTAYYSEHPDHNDRDWLHLAFGVLAGLPAGRGLVDPAHNAVWRAPISGEAAKALVTFWRRRDDAGALMHDFTDPSLDTRFLGDLYQDLSEDAKKTYALLQTPVFVEEFILDQTLTPALAEFGLEGLKMIDPTCGSGHFLLGAFDRLTSAWLSHAPNDDARTRVQHALDAIHGVDLNPFAVAIARFRLTVAALRASGETTLTDAPAFDYHLAIGDSLLGPEGTQDTLDLVGDGAGEGSSFEYANEDLSSHGDILQPGRYHVVVGNPPYITVKDKALNEEYRRRYPTCSGKYALSVPFMELFFRLARRESSAGGAGYVGQITSNSFMKREFGKKVIEVFLAGKDVSSTRDSPVDLVEVIDTSGAFIPGHGTPTVILIGRPRRPSTPTVRAVLGIRGEPGQPTNPAQGLVWTEITTHHKDKQFSGTYVTVTDLPRPTLATHPWSLTGGGAGALKEQIEEAGVETVGEIADSLGITSFTLEDDVYVRERRAFKTLGVTETRPMVLGDQLRDWAYDGDDDALFPYDDDLKPIEVEPGTALFKAFWPYRTNLSNNVMFGRQTKVEAGLKWTEFGRFTASKLRTPLSITYAEVATHNHFVLDRGGKVFKQTAPVIKLSASATESDHLALLGVLNSSLAAFWLKQVSHNKGRPGAEQAGADEPWEHRYQVGATKVEPFPLAAELPEERGRRLDAMSMSLGATSPAAAIRAFLANATPGQLAQVAHAPVADTPSAEGAGAGKEERATPDRVWWAPPRGTSGAGGSGVALSSVLNHARDTWHHTRAEMVFEQEELDWEAYYLYGVTDEDLSLPYDAEMLRIAPAERAFAIHLARQIKSGEVETSWFVHHNHRYEPITDLPPHWPDDYRTLVQRRLDLIATDPFIALLERPEYKRRWAVTPWQTQQNDALKSLILDRLEDPALWRDAHGAITRSVAQLADAVRHDEIIREALQVLHGRPDVDLVPALTTLLQDEAVPYLAAWRLKPSGVTKFREWQHVWALQRAEDAGETVSIPVPPKYAPADFRKASYWRARGKLDVPKERFIAYPGVARPSDPTPVLGWAGWDHANQALALARLSADQVGAGAEREAVVPLLAGLAELEPWLHQWHSAPDPARGGGVPATAITGMLGQYLTRFALTRDDLTSWTPPAPTHGRRARGAPSSNDG